MIDMSRTVTALPSSSGFIPGYGAEISPVSRNAIELQVTVY
jgi:hypothetical protein